MNQYGAAGKNGNGVLVNRDGGFEFQREWSAFAVLSLVPSQSLTLSADRTTILPPVSIAGGIRDGTGRGTER